MKLFYDNTPEKKSSQSADKIEGIIDKVIYKNDENAYAVCELELANGDYHTIEGYMPLVSEGDSVCVHGRWVMNAKYGKQFKVEQYERIIPKGIEDIQKYLAGGAIKGIGPVSAAKIVDKFGESTFDVMENHPEWLADIPGISKRKAREIGEEYKKKSSMRDTMMFFRDFFGMTVIMRIYKRFGKDSIKTVRENPYVLCDEIDGIGFEKADKLAVSIGMDPFSGERVRAGIMYCLDRNLNGNGHMCMPLELVCNETSQSLRVEYDSVLANIGILLSSGILMMYEADSVKYIYAKPAYSVERNIAKRLLRINRYRPVSFDTAEINALIQRQELFSGIEYAAKQKKAIYAAIENGLTVMTGGPGTGKTTVVRALLSIFESMGYKVALCAPTGRASMRLSESTSHAASTIHRLLEMEYHDGEDRGFARNHNNPLEEDIIIVDEASMIDCMLMNSLLSAMKSGSRLVMIGDSDQLPSVGGGNVLGDIIDSGKFPVVRLDEIFRQAKESLIITNAHEINKGNIPVLDRKDSDFFFLESQDDNVIANTVASLCKTRLPKAYSVSPLSDIQVLTPTRKGICGTDGLNVLLQSMLNPPSPDKKEHVWNETVFREGDKVMQMKNNYEMAWNSSDDYEEGSGIFNGDVGIIEEINPTDGYMTVLFDKRRTEYDFSFLEDLSLAYAITVHKSQGSEYPFIIMPLANAPKMLLTRNLFYTAVTRARRMVVLVGDKKIAERMVENNQHSMRYTCLRDMIVNMEV
ncbi:MAG: ATP-dependent RecD-like DNA helicase [Clostridia bacterium]|nr:ATP-dependent RecD-like DNA helicase [Clostridia bacterium]